MAGVSSPEDVVNEALRTIGIKRRIASIFEGSPPARAALDVYSQARDNLLRARDWPFARRDVALAVGPAAPPPPWPFEYVWPADCLRIRYVMPANPGTFPVFDPRPVEFTDFNEQRVTPAVKAILATVSPAMLIYTARITNPTTWDAGFTDAFIEDMGRRLSVALTGSIDLFRARASAAVVATETALSAQVNMPPSPTAPGAQMQSEQQSR